jgi:hypothetical protein
MTALLPPTNTLNTHTRSLKHRKTAQKGFSQPKLKKKKKKLSKMEKKSFSKKQIIGSNGLDMLIQKTSQKFLT